MLNVCQASLLQQSFKMSMQCQNFHLEFCFEEAERLLFTMLVYFSLSLRPL
jgi:hypothetical protein